MGPCGSIVAREITTCVSHIDDSNHLHVQDYVIIILGTCHASASLDIKGDIDSFKKLKCGSFLDENES